MSESHLRPDLTLPSGATDLDEFVLRYGDAYIASLDPGGEFIGGYTFRLEAGWPAEKVKNELALGGLVSGSPLGVDLHHTLENVRRSNATSYNLKYGLRGASQAPALRDDEMVAYAQSFDDEGFAQQVL